MKPSILPLSAAYDRNSFTCGVPQLDNYLKTIASQDIKRKTAVTFVALDGNGKTIQGYYTTNVTGLSREQIPDALVKKYKVPPTIALGAHLLGRLAVDVKFQGQGLGELLLMDALKRLHLISQHSAFFAVVVDPISPAARAFYEKFGFMDQPDSKRMFIPTATLDSLFN
ncbi:GNAT family N-acetyltransferase [Cesiribacter andamanensis]|nr:GNAT family N-acetyltransferase [Cesiribacter andamanensis]